MLLCTVWLASVHVVKVRTHTTPEATHFTADSCLNQHVIFQHIRQTLLHLKALVRGVMLTTDISKALLVAN